MRHRCKDVDWSLYPDTYPDIYVTRTRTSETQYAYRPKRGSVRTYYHSGSGYLVSEKETFVATCALCKEVVPVVDQGTEIWLTDNGAMEELL